MSGVLGFLDLPLLIRCEIYSYVLGGHTFHVCGGDLQLPGTSGSVVLCQDPGRDVEHSLLQRAKRGTEGIGGRHRVKCLGTHSGRGRLQAGTEFTPMRPQLQMLKLCREVHLEAKLVPFKENVFNCASLIDLATMLSRLSDAQAAAIRHATVYSTDRGLEAWNLTGLRKQGHVENISRLRGLRSLGVYVELGSKFREKYNPYMDCTYRISSAERRMMIDGMRIFSTTGLAQTGQLRVRFTDVGPCLNEVPPQYLIAWEEELREALLPKMPKQVAVLDTGPRLPVRRGRIGGRGRHG